VQIAGCQPRTSRIVEGRTQEKEAFLWVPPSIILEVYEADPCVPHTTLLEDTEAVSWESSSNFLEVSVDVS
jgi:hypothetical protein